MLEVHGYQWAVIAGCALLIGVSKTGIPGLGVLIVPALAWILPTKASTGFLLPMLVFADIFAVAYYRRHARWTYLIKLIPWAAIGVIIGYFGLKYVTDQQLRPIIGGIILVMLTVNYWLRGRKDPDELEIPTGWKFAAAMGLAAGITTMMANAAGPIMVIYLLAMGLPKEGFIGTGAWYYLIMNCYKVPFSASLGLITAQSLKINLMLLPVIALGAILGIVALKRIPQKAFTLVVQVLAVAASLKLLLSPLF